MSLTQADNGLALAKMLLCQLCGMPAETEVTLADENTPNIATASTGENTSADKAEAQDNRPEMKLLRERRWTRRRQATNLVRAAYLPQVLLSGGYMATNLTSITDSSASSPACGMWA